MTNGPEARLLSLGAMKARVLTSAVLQTRRPLSACYSWPARTWLKLAPHSSHSSPEISRFRERRPSLPLTCCERRIQGAATSRLPEVEATFRTIEIFKGQPPPDGKVRSFVFGPGNCSVPLLAESDYLFFLYDSNRVLLLPGGSDLVWDVKGTAATKVFEELRELAKKAP